MPKPIRLWTACLVHVGFTAYFYLLLFTLNPALKGAFSWNPAAYWFATGYALFVPLFLAALILAQRAGNKGWREVSRALALKPFTGTDWRYALGGLLITLVSTGAVFFVSAQLASSGLVPPLKTTPWFMEMEPFVGGDRWLLLLWFPMFFFNIVGEELLWRGALQHRLAERTPWPVFSALWLLFHLPFGPDLIILLLPVMLVIPWAFSKTRNAGVGIFIHGMFNGPMFIAVALGWIH